MKSFKEYAGDFYNAFIRIEKVPHPSSRICAGVSLFSFISGIITAAEGYPDIAMLPYTVGGIALLSSMYCHEKELEEDAKLYAKEVIKDLEILDRALGLETKVDE